MPSSSWQTPPQKAGGREYYTDDQNGVAVHFPDNKTLVFGDVKTLPVFLGKPAKADGGLSGALRQAAGNKAVYAAVNVKDQWLAGGLHF